MEENKIIRLDNFISKEQCTQLIKLYNSEKYKKHVYRNTLVLPVFSLKKEDQNITDFILKKLNDRFNIHNFEKPDNYEIVKWPENSFMEPHTDKGKDGKPDVYAFILYLNDDYEGGSTLISDLEIKPKTGRLVLFTNGALIHEVKKITKGVRYTATCWFV